MVRRDDLALILRDAMLYDDGPNLNEELLIKETRQLIAALEKEKIPHVLVGGLAVLQFVEGRNTRDIALIIAVEDYPRLPGFVLREKNEWFGTGDCGPVRVDLLFTANPLFEEVARLHSLPRQFLDTTLNCATPRGIILPKLFALPSLYRQGLVERADLYETDILQLLRLDPATDEELLGRLRAHLIDSDITALREVLHELRTRLGKANRFQS
jgi:hypothetical protein